jgi:hypothetical protein
VNTGVVIAGREKTRDAVARFAGSPVEEGARPVSAGGINVDVVGAPGPVAVASGPSAKERAEPMATIPQQADSTKNCDAMIRMTASMPGECRKTLSLAGP